MRPDKPFPRLAPQRGRRHETNDDDHEKAKAALLVILAGTGFHPFGARAQDLARLSTEDDARAFGGALARGDSLGWFLSIQVTNGGLGKIHWL